MVHNQNSLQAVTSTQISIKLWLPYYNAG